MRCQTKSFVPFVLFVVKRVIHANKALNRTFSASVSLNV